MSDKGRDRASDLTAGEMHAPVLKRLQRHDNPRRAFLGRQGLPWIVGGGLALALAIFVPLARPELSPMAERGSTFFALFWFITAVAAVLGRRRRAPWIAAAVTIFLYIATAWLPFIGLRDLFVLTVVVGFSIFVLAGFNLLFVLEEVVYDIHRLLHVRGQIWQTIPLLVGIVLVPAVFIGERVLGISLGTLQLMVPFGVFVLVIGWIIRLRVHPGGESQLREIHLLVTGAIAGAGLADAVGLLHQAGGIVPSIVAYLTFIFTWFYVSFTTLQRAKYFVRGSDVFPWIALLFSSSFAILSHVHSLYEVAGEAGLEYQVDLRVGYLVFGVWLGLTFFVLRGVWRLLQFIRDERAMGRRVRRTAGQLARVTEELIRTEDRLEGATARLIERVDRMLPGRERKRRKDRRRFR